MQKPFIYSAALLLCAGQAFAMSGVYVEGKGGWSAGVMDGRHLELQYSSIQATDKVLSKDSSYTNVVSYGGAVGYVYDKWIVPLRIETEYLYRNRFLFETEVLNPPGGLTPIAADVDSYTNSTTILGNVYFDVPLADMWALFFGGGAGVGIAQTHTEATWHSAPSQQIEGTKSEYAFSWMGTAGISLIPVKGSSVSLSYRYSDLGNIRAQVDHVDNSFGGPYAGGTHNFTAQEVYLGVRFLLPNMYRKITPY